STCTSGWNTPAPQISRSVTIGNLLRGGSPPTMAMVFAIEDRVVDGGTHIVAVTGEIDLFTAPEFKQRVSAPIDEGRTHVIVDLTDTTFIDSSSLGVLIGAHRRLRRLEGSLVIVCAHDSIVKPFR